MLYGSAFGATKAAAQDEAALQAYNKLKAFPIVPGPVREIGDRVVEDHSSRSDAILIVCIRSQLYFYLDNLP